VEITRIERTDDKRIAETAALAAAARAADAPGGQPIIEASFAAAVVNPEPGHDAAHFAATVDDRIVGYLRLEVAPENPQRVVGNLLVHPDHRCNGYGTALLEFALDRCRAEGRETLALSTIAALEGGPERSSAGTRFLERHRFALALDLVRRRADAKAPGPETEARLWDEARAASAADYAFRDWVGPVPEDLLASMCRMDAMVLQEVPMGDLDMAPEQVDAARLRAKEAVVAAHRKTSVHAVAVHRATEAVVAHSRVDVYDLPEARHCHVVITIVDPAHRGHRLGLLVKLANLRLLRERYPHVTEIWTANAVVNASMIAINERLGYRPVESTGIYQRSVRA
jgi:GNAT superfamily N-acetyltransferase